MKLFSFLPGPTFANRRSEKPVSVFIRFKEYFNATALNSLVNNGVYSNKLIEERLDELLKLLIEGEILNKIIFDITITNAELDFLADLKNISEIDSKYESEITEYISLYLIIALKQFILELRDNNSILQEEYNYKVEGLLRWAMIGKLLPNEYIKIVEGHFSHDFIYIGDIFSPDQIIHMLLRGENS